MDKNILVRINNNRLPVFLKTIIKEIEKSFEEKNLVTLENMTRLSYLLHYFEFDEEAQMLSKEITKISFTKNRNYWNWIEAGIVLNMRYQREIGNNDIVIFLKNKVLQKLEVGPELARKTNRKVFERTLQGEHLSTSKIDRASREKDVDAEFSRRLVYLFKLYFIREMGTTEKFPIENLEQKINSNKNNMKLIEDKVTFFNVVFNS
ncbi:hypothetical protein HCA06_14410 [Listeria welshimeri]|nr:hypothetical protein [Listeria welshimeri]